MTRHRCDYCKVLTKDDGQGNCSACGAPRPEPPEITGGYLNQYGYPLNAPDPGGVYTTNGYPLMDDR